jgi:hypothetical protein
MTTKTKIIIGVSILAAGIGSYFIIKKIISNKKATDAAKDTLDQLKNTVSNAKLSGNINTPAPSNYLKQTTPDLSPGQNAFAFVDTNIIMGSKVIPVAQDNFVGVFQKYGVTPQGNKIAYLTDPSKYSEDTQFIALAFTLRP